MFLSLSPLHPTLVISVGELEMFGERHSFDCVCEDCLLWRARRAFLKYLVGFGTTTGVAGWLLYTKWLSGKRERLVPGKKEIPGK